MLGLVEAGLGVAAVPSMAMPGADHPLLVSVPLDGPVVTRRVGLIRRKGRTLSPAAQQLYGFVRRDGRAAEAAAQGLTRAAAVQRAARTRAAAAGRSGHGGLSGAKRRRM